MPAAEPPRLPPPPERPLLAAPPQPLLLAGPQPFWRRHPRAITAGAVLTFVVLAFAIGWFLHHRRAEAAEDSNQEARDRTPIVGVVPAKRSPDLSELLLPGSLSPLTEASIYARATGYVRRRYVDIGDTVKKGQILAVIESPELDAAVAQGQAATAQARQQLNVARANVGDIEARLALARVTVQRYEVLLSQDSVARQDVDLQRQIYQSAIAALNSANANVGAAAENVRADEANARRLAALQDFERVRAPFDGVVTARSFDEGALIGNSGASLVGSGAPALSSSTQSSSSTGGSSSTSGSSSDSGSSSSSGGTSGGSTAELFRIAQVDRLRVYISVPQDDAAAVQVGGNATVYVQQYDGNFTGRIARTARSIDPTSRTLLTEVQIGNADGRLLTGMYAQVRLASARTNPPLLIPGETLVVRADGAQVAILQPLDDDDRRALADPADAKCARRVHLQPIAIGRDYGTEIEVARGLSGKEFLVVNPGDQTEEGAIVLPKLRDDASSGAAGQGGGKAQGGKGGAASGAGGKSGAGKGNDGKGGGDKGKSGAGDGKGSKESPKQRAEDDRRAREAVQQRCVEEQASQARAAPADAAASRPAPGGEHPDFGPASAPAPGGPSDRTPQGAGSPSMQAPTQGSGKGAGKH